MKYYTAVKMSELEAFININESDKCNIRKQKSCRKHMYYERQGASTTLVVIYLLSWAVNTPK